MVIRTKYRIIDACIGSGAYATVWRGYAPDGTVVALKVVRARKDEYDGISANSQREICILKHVRHANIVRLLDVEIHHARRLCMVFESMDCDLKHYMAEPTSQYDVKNVMKQILMGLSALHHHSFFHRDIKPENLLVNVTSQKLKIADFGLAHRYTAGRTYTLPVCTLPYRAPEIVLGMEKYTLAVDVWSTGCVFAQLLQRSQRCVPVFCAYWETDLLHKIFQRLGRPHSIEGCSAYRASDFPNWPKPLAHDLLFPGCDESSSAPHSLDLLYRLLTINSCERITAKQALQHAYFE